MRLVLPGFGSLDILSTIGCGLIFTSNPNLVPVVVLDGERRPICRACVEAANPERIKRGLDPIVIRPGAYDPAPEYCDDEPYDFWGETSQLADWLHPPLLTAHNSCPPPCADAGLSRSTIKKGAAGKARNSNALFKDSNHFSSWRCLCPAGGYSAILLPAEY